MRMYIITMLKKNEQLLQILHRSTYYSAIHIIGVDLIETSVESRHRQWTFFYVYIRYKYTVKSMMLHSFPDIYMFKYESDCATKILCRQLMTYESFNAWAQEYQYYLFHVE